MLLELKHNNFLSTIHKLNELNNNFIIYSSLSNMLILFSSIKGVTMKEKEIRNSDLDNDPLVDSGFTQREIEANRVHFVEIPVSVNTRIASGIGGFTLSSLVSSNNSRKSSDYHPVKLTENQRKFLSKTDQSNCKGFDPKIFFPDQYDSDDDAKIICAECPIAELCLEYAIDGNEKHGIWGGKNPSERRKIIRLRQNDKRK
jgi:WhiB family redox-sensing transcriptional regulator